MAYGALQRRVSATGVTPFAASTSRWGASTPAVPSPSPSTLAIELDGETRTVRRTTSRPVVVVKANRPHPAWATSTELSAGAGRERSNPDRFRS